MIRSLIFAVIAVTTIVHGNGTTKDLGKQVRKLQDQVKDCKTRLEGLEKELTGYHSGGLIQEKDVGMTEKKMNNAQKKKERKRLHKLIKKLKPQLEACSARTKKVIKELSQPPKSVPCEDTTTLTTELTTVKETLTTVRTELQTQKDDLAKVTSDLADCKVALKGSQSEVSSLKTQVQTFQSEGSTSQKQEITSLTGQLTAKDDRIAQLNAARTKDTTDMNAEIKSLTDRLNAAEGKADSEGVTITSDNEEIQRLTDLLNKAEDDSSTNKASFAQSYKESSLKDAEIKSLTDRLNAAEGKADSEGVTITSDNEEIQRLTDLLNKAEDESSAKGTIIDELEAELAETLETILLLEESLKITAVDLTIVLERAGQMKTEYELNIKTMEGQYVEMIASVKADASSAKSILEEYVSMSQNVPQLYFEQLIELNNAKKTSTEQAQLIMKLEAEIVVLAENLASSVGHGRSLEVDVARLEGKLEIGHDNTEFYKTQLGEVKSLLQQTTTVSDRYLAQLDTLRDQLQKSIVGANARSQSQAGTVSELTTELMTTKQTCEQQLEYFKAVSDYQLTQIDDAQRVLQNYGADLENMKNQLAIKTLGLGASTVSTAVVQSSSSSSSGEE